MARALPQAWLTRLASLEAAHETARADEEKRAERSRTWTITLVSLGVGALLSIVGATVAGAIAYGELRGRVDATAVQVDRIAEDVREVRSALRAR